MAKLESSWNNFLWKMIRGGFSKKTQNQENFTFKSVFTFRLWWDSRYTATTRFYRVAVPKIHGTHLQAPEWLTHQAHSICKTSTQLSIIETRGVEYLNSWMCPSSKARRQHRIKQSSSAIWRRISTLKWNWSPKRQTHMYIMKDDN